ncbi:MAG: hypothetical protein QXU32_06075 [Nitrososphaerales archaeon]
MGAVPLFMILIEPPQISNYAIPLAIVAVGTMVVLYSIIKRKVTQKARS